MHWTFNYFTKMSVLCSIGFVATSFASMQRSANKCWCLGKEIMQTSVLPIKIGGDALEVVNEYSRYLGIWITSSLSWNRHIEEVCKRANRQVGVLYRRFY